MDTNSGSAGPNLRFGLEIEMHAIRMTFIIGDEPQSKEAKWEFWGADKPLPNSRTGKPQVVRGQGAIPIFVPENQAEYLKDGDVNWESSWGFRAVADAGGKTEFQANAKSPVIWMSSFILELQTAANAVEDYNYWACYHACVGIFKNTINDFKSSLANPIQSPIVGVTRRLYPLVELVKRYNKTILSSNPNFGQTRNKFLIDISPELKDLAAAQWHVYFSVDEENDWCDVQVNYQMNLEALDTDMANWLWLWNSMWLRELDVVVPIAGSKKRDFVKVVLDEDNGVVRSVPLAEIYRTKLAAALWNATSDVADDFITSMSLKGIPDHIQPCLVSLATCVFAAGATAFVQEGPSSSKNQFPQLPKTSPCSIAQCMLGRLNGPDQGLVAAAFDKLRGEVERASVAFDRIYDKVVGYLPSPAHPAAPYDDEGRATYLANLKSPDYGVMAPQNAQTKTRFTKLWQGTFNHNASLTQENNFGFIDAEPFCVFWAPKTKTKHPPATYYTGQDGKPHIKVLFESRYGRNKLNVGFDPFANDKMFVQSYLSLVRFLAFGKIDGVMTGLKSVYGLWLNPFSLQHEWGAIGPPLKQNFDHGPH